MCCSSLTYFGWKASLFCALRTTAQTTPLAGVFAFSLLAVVTGAALVAGRFFAAFTRAGASFVGAFGSGCGASLGTTTVAAVDDGVLRLRVGISMLASFFVPNERRNDGLLIRRSLY